MSWAPPLLSSAGRCLNKRRWPASINWSIIVTRWTSRKLLNRPNALRAGERRDIWMTRSSEEEEAEESACRVQILNDWIIWSISARPCGGWGKGVAMETDSPGGPQMRSRDVRLSVGCKRYNGRWWQFNWSIKRTTWPVLISRIKFRPHLHINFLL